MQKFKKNKCYAKRKLVMAVAEEIGEYRQTFSTDPKDTATTALAKEAARTALDSLAARLIDLFESLRPDDKPSIRKRFQKKLGYYTALPVPSINKESFLKP